MSCDCCPGYEHRGSIVAEDETILCDAMVGSIDDAHPYVESPFSYVNQWGGRLAFTSTDGELRS